MMDAVEYERKRLILISIAFAIIWITITIGILNLTPVQNCEHKYILYDSKGYVDTCKYLECAKSKHGLGGCWYSDCERFNLVDEAGIRHIINENCKVN